MAGLWHSERLIYRAVEPEDEPLLSAISTDPEAFVNSAPFLPIPRSKKSSTGYREWLDTMLVAAVICIPPPTDATITASNGVDAAATKPVSIGVVHLAGIELRSIHNRESHIGINIVRRYQGQGFGSEALKWILNWGFNYAQLHRIDLEALSRNKGALKLYESLGFVVEGRKRECIWVDGQYHDVVTLGMLEHEWREIYGKIQR